MKRILTVVLCLLALPVAAYEEPARGTQLRRDLMDAMRPIGEWNLGAPVQFVVHELRVSGDVAFASVSMQRPGGQQIDISRTPLVLRDGQDPDFIDGSTFQALFKRSGNMWVPVRHATGATDVWYAWQEYCPTWGAVLPEACR